MLHTDWFVFQPDGSSERPALSMSDRSAPRRRLQRGRPRPLSMQPIEE